MTSSLLRAHPRARLVFWLGPGLSGVSRLGDGEGIAAKCLVFERDLDLPDAEAVLDTSGSMGAHNLARAPSETQAIGAEDKAMLEKLEGVLPMDLTATVSVQSDRPSVEWRQPGRGDGRRAA